MSFRFRSLLALTIGAVLGISLSLGGGVFAQREPAPGEDLPWEEARLLAEVLERVKQEYVEPVDDRTLIESAVRGMVTDLDSHSQFLDTEEYAEVRISTTGNYSGVGLEVNMRDGVVIVVAPIEGTPADRAGIRSGDEIVRIDGVEVDERNVNDTITRMRGKPGTSVSITVARDGEVEPLSFNVVRSHVQVRSISSALLDDGYGYVRVSHFSETTYKDLRKAVAEMQRQSSGGLEGLIIDMRNNPGGVLDAAIDVSDAFLDGGLIVTASGRGRDSNFRHVAEPGDILDGAPLIVMVNAGSASAAEIVAGALQDQQRALVAGERTFGKGSVQTVMPLSNGRAIKLTTSRYYTPSGDSIHERGITPDVSLEEASFDDLLAGVGEHRTEAGAALLQSDSQLRDALALLKGGQRVSQTTAD